MNEPIALEQIPLTGLGKLRDLLSVIGALRSVTAPLTTADGLRQTVAALLQVAETLGVDPAWTNRLASILQDDGVFNIVLAIIQFLSGAKGTEKPDNTIRVRTAGGDEVVVDSQSFADWLPLVLQLLSLVRQFRGTQ